MRKNEYTYTNGNEPDSYTPPIPPTVVDTMNNDDIECPIDRRTIATVLDAFCQVHFGTPYSVWRSAIYRDEHPDYAIENEDGDMVTAGYCIDKWKVWLDRPCIYIQNNAGYRSGLLDLIQQAISKDIKRRRYEAGVTELKTEENKTKGSEEE